MAVEHTFDFDICTLWNIDSDPAELTAIVLDAQLLDLWCTSVFMYGEVVDPGRSDGLGMSIRLHTKGFLPHSFFFVARIVDLEPHRYMRIEASGDFEGVGELSLEPGSGGCCRVRLHWRTRIMHPWLKPLVAWFHPVFVWNHKWAMRRTRRLIQDEVYRRRKRPVRLDQPQPVFPHNLPRLGIEQRRRCAHRGWDI